MNPGSSIGTLSPWEPGILSLFVYALLVFVLMAASYLSPVGLGRRKRIPKNQGPMNAESFPPERLGSPIPSLSILWQPSSSSLTWRQPISSPGPLPLIVLAGKVGCRYPSLSLFYSSVSSTSGKKEDWSGDPKPERARIPRKHHPDEA